MDGMGEITIEFSSESQRTIRVISCNLCFGRWGGCEHVRETEREVE